MPDGASLAALLLKVGSVLGGDMQQLLSRPRLGLIVRLLGFGTAFVAAGIGGAPVASAQTTTALTWAEVRARFEAANPTLQADQIGIDESKAAEITAYLRPNPQWSLTFDQIGNTASGNAFSAATLSTTVSYLHERRHKRELRRDSAQEATTIASSSHVNLDRTLVFTLRGAFVQVLTAKAALALARDNLTFYDRVLEISRGRLQSGDIAQIDMDRLDLQRVQLESAVETANVNLRTAKIQLLMLLDDRTPVDQFDVAGPFDFVEAVPALDDLRRQALDARPDLRAALQAVDKANVDHRLAVANGSTDPTISVDAAFPSISQVYQSFQPPLRQYVGTSLSVPLRIFDRNQGEKLRTQLDITRTERLTEAARAQVFSDVDSAHATLVSTVNLLRPYKDHYLAQATRVRDIVTFSYQRGGAALLDFLQAEQDYRAVQLSYVNLVGSYLIAAAQLNQAVGPEVIP
jgi:outer membrane protein, heavy metal efflux system